MTLKLKSMKKGSLGDVMWLMVIVSVFIVFMNLQLQSSKIVTVDMYAKEIVNSAAITLSQNLSGFALKESDANMFHLTNDNNSVKRPFSNRGYTNISSYANNPLSSNLDAPAPGISTGSSDTTAIAIMKRAILEAKAVIIRDFGGDPSTACSGYVSMPNVPMVPAFQDTNIIASSSGPANIYSHLKPEDINITFKDTGKSTLVTIEVKYDVLLSMYDAPDDASFVKVKPKERIHRKVVVTRTIPNISRYR